MNLNIHGEYCFKIPITTMFLNTSIEIKGTNLITSLGESFFLQRCIDDTLNPIEYIVIGNGVNAPTKKDQSLGNETRRENTVKEVDTDNKRLILTSSFTTNDLIGITEIGVMNTSSDDREEILISHDTFYEDTLSEDFLSGVVGQVQVQYIFQFSTSQIKSGWQKVDGTNNVYYAYEPNKVKSVMDNTNSYGLSKVNNVESVERTVNSYYYDANVTNNIYIHLNHNVGETAPDPNDY